MSARALEFVETWVSEKIKEIKVLPAEGDEAAAKAWASECLQAALDEDIPAAEIQEAFDNLAEFITGEIEEARERKEALPDAEDNEELLWKVEDEEDEDDK
jgi:Lhr-like helicase